MSSEFALLYDILEKNQTAGTGEDDETSRAKCEQVCKSIVETLGLYYAEYPEYMERGPYLSDEVLQFLLSNSDEETRIVLFKLLWKIGRANSFKGAAEG
ncbi:MAG: hypothetical protein NUW37_18260 [Planctomycetes bacterium]|nr:hypothetical protein [Planctomycetota bacterium]